MSGQVTPPPDPWVCFLCGYREIGTDKEETDFPNGWILAVCYCSALEVCGHCILDAGRSIAVARRMAFDKHGDCAGSAKKEVKV